ncbi:MAG: chorismate synthase, partial [Candidatus Omnitrophica bacterium]|nr:chorismate synthase [Candidatus Omnitrophota bacterium]
MLKYTTAGESHGKALLAILEGMPAGIKIDKGKIDLDLKRRQGGYGRGKRMDIERDRVEILSGVRKDITLGSPIALSIENKDYKIEGLPSVSCPRPGHADLAGALKYNTKDIRNILERASARETAGRVAAGAICKMLLGEFGIEIISHVIGIGKIKVETNGLYYSRIKPLAEKSELRCVDKSAEKKMIDEIDEAGEKGDTLGGVFEIAILGVPVGLGSFMQPDLRLDGRLARALMSIQSVKAVEIGNGLAASKSFGSDVHDAIYFDKNKKCFYRKTNNAGGIEGGLTNGESIIIRAFMKPISTLMSPMASVNVVTKKSEKAATERSDICVVPAAGVV